MVLSVLEDDKLSDEPSDTDPRHREKHLTQAQSVLAIYLATERGLCGDLDKSPARHRDRPYDPHHRDYI